MDAPRCPKCGSKMVLRTARQGRFAGKQFWGCSRYPNCKGIINIDNNAYVSYPNSHTENHYKQEYKHTPSQGERVLRFIGGIIVIALGFALARGFDVITDFAFCYGRKGSPSWILAFCGIAAGYMIIKGEKP